MSSSSSGATGATGGTSTDTTTTNASSTSDEAKVVIPDTTGTTLTTDVYGMFIGAFFVVLSVIVLIATGSILSVLVLWAVVALVLTVMVYYGFVTVDQLFGAVAKEEKKGTTTPEKPVSRPSGGPLVGSEVFHVADQQFTYDEAPAVCAAYGAELATLEQIMDAFANGAEWCGYGWSAGGMALYPTQRETWQRLQGEVDNGKRTRCGRPGVNGGYFDPNLKFGVNCFGFKPPGAFTPPAPVPGVDGERFNEMVNRFKELLKSFTLNPYSRQEWSEYGNPAVKPETKETFMGGGGGYFNAFKQDFFTPYGVREHIVGSGSSDYYEPVGQSGLGQGASALRAPYGLRGDVGEIGPTGARGEQGLRGDVGEGGAAGAVGPTGEQGTSGLVGPIGPTGQRGERGEDGKVAGVYGPTGEAGADGREGPTGQMGPTGRPGINGTNGADGTRGEKGERGEQGPQGTNAVLPSDLVANSIRIGNVVIDDTRNKGQLQIRQAGGDQESGVIVNPSDWGELWLSRGSDWRRYD
jgi:hypothetical protein